MQRSKTFQLNPHNNLMSKNNENRAPNNQVLRPSLKDMSQSNGNDANISLVNKSGAASRAFGKDILNQVNNQT